MRRTTGLPNVEVVHNHAPLASRELASRSPPALEQTPAERMCEVVSWDGCAMKL